MDVTELNTDCKNRSEKNRSLQDLVLEEYIQNQMDGKGEK
jgi:hypothetical protein